MNHSNQITAVLTNEEPIVSQSKKKYIDEGKKYGTIALVNKIFHRSDGKGFRDDDLREVCG